jgi:hypothetical protein
VRDDLVLHAQQIVLEALHPLSAGIVRHQQYTART